MKDRASLTFHMDTLKVFGHTTPDTDTTCAAIAYAWYLREVANTPADPYTTGPLNRETTAVLTHFGVTTPPQLERLEAGDCVALVDTNNPEELLPGWEEATITHIIDHHKLIGGLRTSEPISITMQPVACTTTLIWDAARTKNVSIPREVAGLMLAAIISDTLKFTSPTTTPLDREAAEALTTLSESNIDSLAEAMFAAKSDLSGLSARNLVTGDSKIYPVAGKRIRISVLETTKPENALTMAGDLQEAMRTVHQEEALDGFFFFIIDILQSNAELLVATPNDQAIAEKAFGKPFTDNTVHLPGVVSRKKQILPPLEAALN